MFLFFSFVHILSPHGPSRYDKNCNKHSVLSADISYSEKEEYRQDLIMFQFYYT